MKRVLRVRVLLVGFALLCPSHGHSQAVTGALSGRVLSADGEPLGGVVVNVDGAGLQGQRARTSDADGRFVFPALPAGEYSVRLRQVGFTPLRVANVTVVLGGTTPLGELRLAPQSVELPEVVVSGARPLIDPTTTANATVLDSSVFLALPTDRNFRALLPLVPEADPSPYGDGTNVAGATGLENGYFADGINITDPNVGDGSLNLPYNFVREVQVTTGGYEAEYGRTQGGLVNVVTNSGGNEFHGQVLGFFTGDGLRAAPRWGEGQSRVAKFSQYDVGLSIGGPIRRDRLWFYAAYNPTFESSDASFSGIPTQQDLRITHLFAGKLTGRPGPATDVTLTLLGDPSVRDEVGPAVPEASVSDPRAVLGRLREGGTAVALQVRHQIGHSILLTASLARLDRAEDQTPRAGATTDLAALTQIEDNVNNVTSGGWGLSQTTHASRSAGQASLTFLAGNHAVKLGAEYEDNLIRFDELGSQLTIDAVRAGTGLDTTYSLFQDGFHADAHNRVSTVYVQDSWAVSERLRLNVGLRWEEQLMFGDTGVARSIAPELAPRVGVVFQPGAPGADKVTLSYGRFFEEIPVKTLVAWVGVFSQFAGVYPHNPLVDTTGGVVQGGSQVGEAPDRNIKGQQYDEWSAGYERRLGGAYRIGVRGTYRTLLWAVEDGAPDLNSPFTMGNPGRGALAYLPRAKRDYRALEVTLERAGPGPLTFLASYVLSRSWGNYTGLYATDALTTLGNAGPQFDFPEQTVNASGPLPNDHKHVGKFVGSYRFPIGLTVGTSALVASGEPLSEYGAASAGLPWWTFVVPRGTAGRTPSTWNVDLRFAYDAPVSRDSRLRPRILLDVFNVGNQRKPLTYNQQHYTTPDRSGVNPNYLAVTQYQAPLHARMGVVFDF